MSPVSNAIADIDEPVHNLAGNAETQIGFGACAHDADEFAGASAALEGDLLNLHRPLGFRRRRGLCLAARKESRDADQSERAPNSEAGKTSSEV